MMGGGGGGRDAREESMSPSYHPRTTLVPPSYWFRRVPVVRSTCAATHHHSTSPCSPCHWPFSHAEPVQGQPVRGRFRAGPNHRSRRLRLGCRGQEQARRRQVRSFHAITPTHRHTDTPTHPHTHTPTHPPARAPAARTLFQSQLGGKIATAWSSEKVTHSLHHVRGWLPKTRRRRLCRRPPTDMPSS